MTKITANRKFPAKQPFNLLRYIDCIHNNLSSIDKVTKKQRKQHISLTEKSFFLKNKWSPKKGKTGELLMEQE